MWSIAFSSKIKFLAWARRWPPWLQSCERPWARGMQLSCAQIPEPQKPWDSQCPLFSTVKTNQSNRQTIDLKHTDVHYARGGYLVRLWLYTANNLKNQDFKSLSFLASFPRPQRHLPAFSGASSDMQKCLYRHISLYWLKSIKGIWFSFHLLMKSNFKDSLFIVS